MAIVNGAILPFSHFSICLLLNALCISVGIYLGVEPLHKVGNVLFLNNQKTVWVVVVMLCGSLFPNQGLNPRPTAVKVPSLNHWPTREFPKKKKKMVLKGEKK